MDRHEELLSALGGWSGFEIASFERREGDSEEIWITLRRKDEAPLHCGACGREASRVNNTQAKLLECVTIDRVRQHQAALQAIADANGGIRETGTPGYDAQRHGRRRNARSRRLRAGTQRF